jgi:hypothetical protein
VLGWAAGVAGTAAVVEVVVVAVAVVVVGAWVVGTAVLGTGVVVGGTTALAVVVVADAVDCASWADVVAADDEVCRVLAANQPASTKSAAVLAMPTRRRARRAG